MTFEKFDSIVKTKYPQVTTRKNITDGTTCVIFRPNSKVYEYKGTYGQVLEKLGFETITKREVQNLEEWLKYEIEIDGKPDELGFSDIVDNTESIKNLKRQLKEIYDNFIIID